jgi:hypothetical protein
MRQISAHGHGFRCPFAKLAQFLPVKLRVYSFLGSLDATPLAIRPASSYCLQTPKDRIAMSFLKTLFWIVTSAIVVLFSLNNWLPVTVNLWGSLQADVKLPILMLFFFLLGFAPAVIYYRTKNWKLGRRLDSAERELTDARNLKRFRAPERAGSNPATASDELALDSPEKDEAAS